MGYHRLSITHHHYNNMRGIQSCTHAIDKLTKHSYLGKCQAHYLSDKKQSLHSEKALVLGDFAENYQFLIQDEIQSYHWSK